MMRLMAVMAHPDDAEIWCGGTLFLHAEKGDPVRICTISYSGGSTRGREGKQGADKMDCEVEFLGSKDTAIRDTDEIVGKGEMGSDFVISLFCFCGPRPYSFPTNYMIKCPGK